MSESVEMTEKNETESQENTASTVAAQYELFNKELGLDDTPEPNKDKVKESSKDEAAEPATGGDAAETSEKKAESSKAGAEESTDKAEEPEEPDSDDEAIEDDTDEWGGDDPTEAEVEPFSLPEEQVVISDLTDQSRRRRVVIYPIKLGELGHPSVVEVIKNCIDFKTTFMQCKMDGSNSDYAFQGIVEFNCKSTVGAVEALETLKNVREDVKARIMEPGETAKKLMQSWNADSAATPSTIIQNLLIVKPLAEEVTVEQMRDLFPDASDIMISQPKGFPRLAYVSYDDSKAVDEIVSRYSADRPAIGECQLKVFKYQPPYIPTGFLKMKRRYRILLQVKKLRKALKDTKASYSENQRNKMKSTIDHCASLIEKDDAARNEMGLKPITLQELRRIRKIRESVKPETIWLPRQPGDKREDHSRIYLGEDDDKESTHEKRTYSKYPGKRFERFPSRTPPPHGKWHEPRGGPGGVPSLMSMPMDAPLEPMARVQALTQHLAQMACMLNPPMRGGRGGTNRDRGAFRGGRFGQGRGGFHRGDMDAEFGPPPGGFGPRRGGGFGSGGGNFNKRPRQDSSGDREPRDIPDITIIEEPRNRIEDAREPAGKMFRQDAEPSWSSDVGKADVKPIKQPFQPQNQPFSSSTRGRQSGWSKPPSKFTPGGGSSSGGFNKPTFNQGGFKRGGSQSQGGYGGYNKGGGGFNQGSGTGYNQGGSGRDYSQGSGTGYSQGGGAYNQGSGGSGGGGFNSGSGGYSQGGAGSYNQGSGSGYNQGSAGGYNQGSAGGYNQGSSGQSQGSVGYNQSAGSYDQGSGSYNQSAGTYNQGSGGYNQPVGGSGYQQSSGSYGSQSTGYNYNYSSQTGTGAGTYQASQGEPAQPVASQQAWSATSGAAGQQTYWQQQPSQGTWQPAAQPTGQAQPADQSSYNYGWNTWK